MIFYVWIAIAAAFYIALLIYLFVKKVYPFLIVSGAGTVTMIVLTLIYTYDAYINPNRLNDGRYVSDVMRLLASDDDVRNLASGIINGCILIAILLAIFIICLVILQQQKKKAKTQNL